MAKVTIIFEDMPEGGSKTKVRFNPALEKGKPMTQAQQIGYAFLEGLQEANKREEAEQSQGATE